MLFPNVLVMLSASPRMSGFIYQVRYIVYIMSPSSVLNRVVNINLFLLITGYNEMYHISTDYDMMSYILSLCVPFREDCH